MREIKFLETQNSNTLSSIQTLDSQPNFFKGYNKLKLFLKTITTLIRLRNRAFSNLLVDSRSDLEVE